MRLTARLRWSVDGTDLDPRVIALAEGIAEHGSLKQAIGGVGLSYRHAWDLLGRAQAALGEPLVELVQGRGARLTALGAELVRRTRAVEARVAPELKRTASLPRARSVPDVPRVSICASHDFALGLLADLLAERGSPRIELYFQGSTDALAALARGRCDVAGFHVPELPGRVKLVEPYRPWLKSRRLRFIHFADRRQGLIVARGNPLRIRSLADLVRKRARFVNRQAGSGTRIFFDALLAANRLRASQINGYGREEFTHAAVAAMIASGVADAAFGIEHAAAEHGLDFVPLASERYFLAASEPTLARPGARALVEALHGRRFRSAARRLKGYTLPAEAEPLSAKEAFGAL